MKSQPLPAAPSPPAGRLDLLRLPGLGGFLRWRHSRTVAQAGVLAVALLLVLDGFFGPQLAHRNWAGVIPWIHWRGFVVLSLLLVGNVFCFACPFMLPRRLAKRLFPADRPWPRALRSKWLAAGLLVAFFWGYEAFDLWASPWLTAWVVAGYFVLAFVVDGVFRGAAFCKHVCPVGNFNFVHSTLSPFEVAVRDPGRCSTCATKECIQGSPPPPLRAGALPVLPFSAVQAGPVASQVARAPMASGDSAVGTVPRRAPQPRAPRRPRPEQSGCELWLFQPRKVGNLDCTFCLECVQACPHDNVGILSREPARELWEDPLRSGVGRLSQRPDFAAMALILVSAAFINAFGMTTPVYPLLDAVGAHLGTGSALASTGVLFLGGLVLLPLALVASASLATRLLAREPGTLVEIGTRYVWGMVPVGFGMWLAHYLFHFLHGALTVIPVGQQYLRDLGWWSGQPAWSLGAIVPVGWILPLELLLLETGFLVGLLVTWRIGRRLHPGGGPGALLASLPWMLLTGVLSGAGIWLLLQPMDMRGMFGG